MEETDWVKSVDAPNSGPMIENRAWFYWIKHRVTKKWWEKRLEKWAKDRQWRALNGQYWLSPWQSPQCEGLRVICWDNGLVPLEDLSLPDLNFCQLSSPFKPQVAPKRPLKEHKLTPQPIGSRILITSLQQRQPEMPIDLREGVQHPRRQGWPSGITGIGHCKGQNQ